ncbi:MAG: TonB-dependent receptor plug domain-containing protein [Bacteroidales bacterium]|nr:TonB-dependent receptor plug domain-containing protein [Bacteroidales bacterium]MDY5262649.1 TonB-dependent receptor plug domain-containing protein [Candidatus Cryptobacteroides sp.]
MYKSLSLIAAALVLPAAAGAQTDTTAIFVLDGSSISASIANAAISSLRLTDINQDKLRENAPGRTFPEMIRNIPGVYSTSETGSFGDAKINIRGFKQENISVLLNGIPISGLTSGSMYWNNWMGLSDATASIQVQKGIGNSMLSDNSVGGTVNILTMRPSERPRAEAGWYHTGAGVNNAFINISTGNMPKGWNLTLMGSYNWGSTFVGCSRISSGSFLAVLDKSFRGGHRLNFTALGSPETHQQRSVRLSYDEVEKYGVSYNKSWGWQTAEDGSRFQRTTARNNYFKPYFTLTHSYDGGSSNAGGNGWKAFNTFYLAIASGGGYYSESSGRRISSFVIPEGNDGEGQIDWDAVIADNAAAAPDEYGRRANNVMTDYLAGHIQAGLKSNIVKEFGDRSDLDAGIHWQIYDTWEKERITDLLGADYWYEDYEHKSLAGLNGRNPIKGVGDYVRTHNGRIQNYFTAYALAHYKAGNEKQLIFTLGASVSATCLRRWDLYNYTESEKWSDRASQAGGSVKGGVLYRLGRYSKFYANAAFYSRVPYASVFFSNGNNEISRDISNERNTLGEIGYRLACNTFGAEITGYAALWKNKALLSSPYSTIEEDPVKYMVKGLDAFHYGLEADLWWSPERFFRLDAFASVGDWRWKNDVTATIYDPTTLQPMGNVNVYADGLHVGDAPQTQIGASVRLSLTPGLDIRAEWSWNDRYWADFDPVSRTDPEDRADSYRIPSYHLFNVGVKWTGSIRKMGIVLFLNANNIADARYIERSKDGAGHDRATFTGYWAEGRNLNFGIRLML